MNTNNNLKSGNTPRLCASSSASRQLAAQAWCEPETSSKEMDVELAEAFARILDRQELEIRREYIVREKPTDWQRAIALVAQTGITPDAPAYGEVLRLALEQVREELEARKNRANIQAQIDALPPEGGVVELPVGGYSIKGLKLPLNVVLRGGGSPSGTVSALLPDGQLDEGVKTRFVRARVDARGVQLHPAVCSRCAGELGARIAVCEKCEPDRLENASR